MSHDHAPTDPPTRPPDPAPAPADSAHLPADTRGALVVHPRVRVSTWGDETLLWGGLWASPLLLDRPGTMIWESSTRGLTALQTTRELSRMTGADPETIGPSVIGIREVLLTHHFLWPDHPRSNREREFWTNAVQRVWEMWSSRRYDFDSGPGAAVHAAISGVLTCGTVPVFASSGHLRYMVACPPAMASAVAQALGPHRSHDQDSGGLRYVIDPDCRPERGSPPIGALWSELGEALWFGPPGDAVLEALVEAADEVRALGSSTDSVWFRAAPFIHPSGIVAVDPDLMLGLRPDHPELVERGLRRLPHRWIQIDPVHPDRVLLPDGSSRPLLGWLVARLAPDTHGDEAWTAFMLGTLAAGGGDPRPFDPDRILNVIADIVSTGRWQHCRTGLPDDIVACLDRVAPHLPGSAA